MHMRRITVIVVLLAVVSGVAVWFWGARVDAPGGLLVTALDVGHGDAILIRTPHGDDILIDAGPPSGHVVERLAAHLPPSDREIELVVVSHTDSDHIGGLVDIAAHYRIGRVLDSGMTSTNPSYATWLDTLRDEHVDRVLARAGVTVDIDGVKGSVWWPETDADLAKASTNDTSVVLEIDYGITSFLFTGDASAAVETRLLQNHIVHKVDVLKVAHHGSAYSSSVAFLDVVMPHYAIVSVGKGDSYGHPHAVILDRLKMRGATVLRTDEVGDVMLESNGTRVRKRS